LYNGFTKSVKGLRMETPFISSLVRRLHLHIRKRGFEELLAAGHTELTAAHMYVFQSPGPEGLRPSELAVQNNMTKQAMNHLLAGLERNGYLERIPAEGDGRGKVLRVTERGRDVERIMMALAMRMETAWSKALGKKQLEQLRAALLDINELIDDD
jgi:DNA-binding MarR family transcriptional regulator